MATVVLGDQALRDTLVAAVTARRMAGSSQAHELERLADYARATDEDDVAALEVSTLLCISDRAAQGRLRLARELTERLPRTLQSPAHRAHRGVQGQADRRHHHRAV